MGGRGGGAFPLCVFWCCTFAFNLSSLVSSFDGGDGRVGMPPAFAVSLLLCVGVACSSVVLLWCLSGVSLFPLCSCAFVLVGAGVGVG